MRSDKGDEYINRNFEEFCKRTGVMQQFTAPDTPQQKGISERMGEIIMNVTRCFLVETDLPKRLWCELASITAVFFKNRMSHSALSNVTIHYRMFGKNTDLLFLRIIGLRAFVHVEGHHEKLDQRAWERIRIRLRLDWVP